MAAMGAVTEVDMVAIEVTVAEDMEADTAEDEVDMGADEEAEAVDSEAIETVDTAVAAEDMAVDRLTIGIKRTVRSVRVVRS